MKKLGKPAPDLPIHPEDQDFLVDDADIAWWNSMTLEVLAKLEREDFATRTASIKYQIEKIGETEEAAVRHTMRSLPWYYGRPGERESQILGLTSEDAGLPWILKGRVIEAAETGKITKKDCEQSSSINALIRRLIRVGSI